MKRVKANKTEKKMKTSTKAKVVKKIDLQTETEVTRLFDQLASSESKFDASSLDAKMSARIEELGYSTLSSRIAKKNRSNSSKKKANWFTSRSWGNLLIATLVILLMLTTTASIYLWPRGDNNDTNVPEGPATAVATPTALLRPTVLTDSGYVSTESSFQISTASQLKDPETLISFTPEIQFEINEVTTSSGEVIEVIPDQPLEKGQKYTISLAGTETSEGTITDTLDWVVPIEPEFEVISISPADGAKEISLDATFEVEFNHKNVDSDTASEFITISPDVEFVVSTVGNLLLIDPVKTLEPDTLYTITIYAGLSNADGESLGKEYATSFTAVSAGTDQKGLSWDRPITEVIMNRAVIARARSASTESITYELYEINANSIEGQVEALTSSTADGSVQPLASEELSDGEYFIYEEVLPATYLVVADDGNARIGQKVVISSMMVHFARSGDLLMGWVFDAESGVSIADLGIEAVSATQTDSLRTNRDGYFAVPVTATRIMIDRGDESLIVEAPFIDIPPESLNGGVKANNSFVDIYFDKPEYAIGDRVNFYIPLTDVISQKLLIEADDPFTLEIREGNSDEGELLHSEIVNTDDPGEIRGSFLIEGDREIEHLRFELIHEERSILVSNIRVRPSVIGDMSVKAVKSEVLLGESLKFTFEGYEDAESASLMIYRSPISNTLNDKARKGDELWGSMEKVVNEQITLDPDGSTDYLYTPYVNDPLSDQHVYLIIINSQTDLGSRRGEMSFRVYESALNIDVTVDASIVNQGDPVDIILSTDIFYGERTTSIDQLELTLLKKSEATVSTDSEYDPYLDANTIIETIRLGDDAQVDRRKITITTGEEIKVQYDELDAGTYSLRVGHTDTQEEFTSLFTVIKDQNELTSMLGDVNMTVANGSIDVSIKSISGGEGEVDALIYLSTDPANYQIGTPGNLQIDVSEDGGIICVAYPKIGLYSSIWANGCTRYGGVLGVGTVMPGSETDISDQEVLSPPE